MVLRDEEAKAVRAGETMGAFIRHNADIDIPGVQMASFRVSFIEDSDCVGVCTVDVE